LSTGSKVLYLWNGQVYTLATWKGGWADCRVLTDTGMRKVIHFLCQEFKHSFLLLSLTFYWLGYYGFKGVISGSIFMEISGYSTEMYIWEE
jgi:hypothetical protein